MIGAAFVLPVLGKPGAGGGGGGVITPGYSYRRRFIIPPDVHRLAVSDGSTVLPVLLQEAWLCSAANGGKVQSSAGHDIRFETDSGVKLEHDLASYVPATGRVEAWLRIPSSIANADLTFNIVYGNTSIAGAEANPLACWDGFRWSVDMSTGLDASPSAAHLNMVDMAPTTLLGMGAANLTTGQPPTTVTPAQWLANPFNANSPQHRPIGTGAVYTAIAQSLARIAGAGLNSDNGGGTNVYTIAPSDPVRTVTSDGSVGGTTGLPVNVQVPQSAAIGGAVNDRTIIFFDPNTYLCHQFYHWGTSVVTPTAGRYVVWDVRGLGLNVGTSASKKAALLGLNRTAEIDGTGPIRHAQEVTANRFSTTAVLSRDLMWPAFGRDSSADEGTNNQGELPYGALLAVPTVAKGGPDKSTLGLTTLGGRLFDQVRDFGVYVMDGTSSTNLVFRADQGMSAGLQTEFKAEMAKIIPHLKWISNNAENQTASGGGTPIATAAPLG